MTLGTCLFVFFFSSRRRHTRYWRDWSSDVCSSDLRYDRNVGRAVLGMGPPEHAWQHVDTAHGVDHTGCGVYSCVGVSYGAVYYGEEDDHPPDPPIVLRHGGPRVGILGVRAHPAEAPAHHRGVGAY